MSFGSYVKSKYLRLCAKIVMEKHSPEYIARGWAIGMFYGCAIPFGFQLVLSIPTAFLLKGSKIGSAVGTLITNHFTIFIIYPVQCWVGNRLIGGTLNWEGLVSATRGLVVHHTYHEFLQLGTEVIISFFAGGLLMAAILTPTVYIAVLVMVKRYRRFREQHPGFRMKFLHLAPADDASASRAEEGEGDDR